MGNDRLNTTEASADLARNLEHWRQEVGKLHSHIDRLRAEAREAALQYLSDTGQLSDQIDDLLTANAALAADNARLGKRVDEARGLIDRGLWLTQEAPAARAWLAGGDA